LFLLPQRGPMWRRAQSSGLPAAGRLAARHASAASKAQPVVLEKPAKFNPPSHGSRLPKAQRPRHYGGDLSAAEVQAQTAREYPGTMAPKGTWSHWVWNGRMLHLFITLSTLGGLAVYTMVENIRQTSPFADMIPSRSDFASHPVSSTRTTIEVLRLTEAQRSTEVAEKRKQRVDDVAKRSQYRKAHGLDTEQGFGAWTAKSDAESLGPALPLGDGTSTTEPEAEGKRKKFMGIF